jgi:hypothetical protein
MTFNFAVDPAVAQALLHTAEIVAQYIGQIALACVPLLLKTTRRNR